MLIVDDLATGPIKMLAWVARQVDRAVSEERGQLRDELMIRLRELHRAFEAGDLSEREFDDREEEILDRLDQLDGAEGDFQ